jgi:hypothetical protein
MDFTSFSVLFRQNLSRGGQCASVALMAVSLSFSAHAADKPAPASASMRVPSDEATEGATSEAEQSYGGDVRAMVPQVSYTYSAVGAPAKTVGAAFTGFGLGERGQSSVLGGGVTVWGAPIARLTLIGDATRSVYREFAPSLGATFRLLGKPNEGFSLGALGRYKVDGFGRGPSKDEVEGEIEGGLLFGYNRQGVHLDANTIVGFGTTEEGEVDIEARARAGYDVGKYLRVGVDAQSRVRVAGPLVLANGRSWDWVLGPQAMVASGHFFGSFLVGPTTTGTLSPKVGAIVALSFGGTAF